MKPLLLTLAFAAGGLVALHLAMAAQIGALVANPRMANAAFWVVGAVMACLLALSNWDKAFFSRAHSVPPWLWIAGAIGACLVFVFAAIIPKLGAGTTNVCVLAGQLIGGFIIARFGVLSSPVEHLTPVRVVGIVLMILGATLAVMGKLPFSSS